MRTISYNGYSIEQHVKQNTIVIHLPQTLKTLNTTLSQPIERRLSLTDGELSILLMMAVQMYEGSEQ